jgi:hypothetical protein
VLLAATDRFPLVAPTIALIDVEAEVPVHPEGKVHIYEVAPVTAEILYVCEKPWHTAELPDIEPGCAGVEATVTLNIRAVLIAQTLFAETEILPPEAPAVVVIEVVVELPVHPEGRVHI